TAGQLSSESETKNNAAVYSASYTYTPYGNRAQMSYTSGGTTEVTDYTYDANNRLTNEATSVVGDVKSAIRYYYDKYGNQVKTETIGDTTLTTQNEYDYLDRVTTATDARGNSTTYTYNYDGQVLTETIAAKS
ncbi:MAG: hypothetical protein IJH17_04680, partial [Clostridia bacterium]|nr:hypothetical protein [Clostridia bacterium]